MDIAARGWRRCTLVYRALVVAQTLGLATSSLVRVVTRVPRLSLVTPPIAVALAIGSAVGIVVGVLMYSLRETRSDKRNVVVSWACLQVAGFLALIGYAVSGTAICFVVEILALVGMHALSPNRLRLR